LSSRTHSNTQKGGGLKRNKKTIKNNWRLTEKVGKGSLLLNGGAGESCSSSERDKRGGTLNGRNKYPRDLGALKEKTEKENLVIGVITFFGGHTGGSRDY